MDSDSNSDMEQFTDSDTEISESDVEEIENTDSYVRVSVRVWQNSKTTATKLEKLSRKQMEGAK